MKTLLVEDDLELANFVSAELQNLNYSVEHVTTLSKAQKSIAIAEFDLMIVDRMLSDGDGLAVIDDVRARGLRTPTLVLSALGEIEHRVEGLRRGGDDYLTKPFSIYELVARAEALHRRANDNSSHHLVIGNLAIDVLSQHVTRGDREVRLQPREFKLLEFLARHADQVVTRSMLLDRVWGLNFDPQTNVVDVHISRLRRKLEQNDESRILHTVRGQGYVLSAAH